MNISPENRALFQDSAGDKRKGTGDTRLTHPGTNLHHMYLFISSAEHLSFVRYYRTQKVKEIKTMQMMKKIFSHEAMDFGKRLEFFFHSGMT